MLPLRWPERAHQLTDAVDAERRHRREQAMAGRTVSPPPRLGDGLRHNSPFVLPEEDDDEIAGTSTDRNAAGEALP